jgi:hypothetical protein
MAMPWDDFLDPEAPDLTLGVPDRFLSGHGFAYRLLRIMAEKRRAGFPREEILGLIEARCEGLVMTSMYVDPGEPGDEEGGDGR